MYKVLIADDEPIIREGLRKIIDWNSYGFKIVGEAENGEEALRKIQKLQPDLCIVDIKMPEIDGLDLITKIKEKNIKTKVIILTGYPEFEYAQKAIDLGVETYILKPVDPSVLIGKIKKIYLQLEEERLIHRSLEISREKILERIIKGEIKDLSEREIKIYDLDFPWESYEIILISSNYNLNSLLKEFKSIFPYSFIIDKYLLLLVKDFSSYYKKKIIELRNIFRKKYNADITVSFGEKVKRLQDLPHSFETALEPLKRSFLYNYKGIIYPYKKGFDNLKEVNETYILERIIKSIENYDLNNLCATLEEKMKSHLFRKDSEEEIKLSYLNLYIYVINYLSSNYPKFKEISSKYLEKKILNEFYTKKSLLDLNNFTKDLFLDVIKKLSELVGYSIISKIIEYIQANYYKDLKLKEIARNFGYNSCYFGKIFRKYTGEKFNVYLDKIRIEKAKEMLLSGMKVSDVAEKVGFKDLDYFLYKFKRYVGKSPQSFKSEMTENF